VVRSVLRLAGEIKLSDQPVEPALDLEVHVRRRHIAFRSSVPTRLNGAKTIAPGRIRRETREAFGVGVQRRQVGVARMTVFPRRIGLPDIDAGTRNRCAERLSTRPRTWMS
jgi:hypothetical protein